MIQHKLPEMVAIRKHVHEVIDNDEFEAIEDHWKQVTQQQQHQGVVHHQWKLFEAAIGVLHMEEADKKWMDPANSPVMSDAWHMVHVYFMAVAKGDLEPMLDWMVDVSTTMTSLSRSTHTSRSQPSTSSEIIKFNLKDILRVPIDLVNILNYLIIKKLQHSKKKK